MADNIYRRYRHGRGYIFCFYVGNRISSLTSVSHFFLFFFSFPSRTRSFLFLSFRFRFYMVSPCPIVSRMYVCLIPKGPSNDHRKRSIDICILPISQGSRYYCTCKETIGNATSSCISTLSYSYYFSSYVHVCHNRATKRKFRFDRRGKQLFDQFTRNT